MNRGLRERIKEKADNTCKICNKYCGASGSPHHVVKRSEEPLLTNCETNVWWVCETCHTKTENIPGYNRELQRQLQDYYYSLFSATKYYNLKDIQLIVNIPMKDLEKAVYKGFLKAKYNKALGEDVIRFLLGGRFYE